MPGLRARLAIFITGVTVIGLAVWTYVAKHDLAGSWRSFQTDGDAWPPRPMPGEGPLDHAIELGSSLLPAVGATAALALALGAVALSTRIRTRRQRASGTVRMELQLGRDDLAEPYEVQQAFEAIVGSLTARRHRRWLRGQDHFALEVHRVADASIRYTIAAPAHQMRALQGPLQNLYPDVLLREVSGAPSQPVCVVRLKKRRPFVLSLQTTRSFDSAFGEALATALDAYGTEATVQIVLAPASEQTHARARRLLKKRERHLQRADDRDPRELGIDSIVEAKELKGALETQHRSLLNFDLRISGAEPAAVRHIAGLFAGVRSENELVSREMRLRRALYARRISGAVPNPLPSRRTGVISTSELASMWHLPRARVKNLQLPRRAIRRAIAPPEVDRKPDRALLRDERGPVGLHPDDRRFGHALIGGQGTGKSSILARHFAADAAEEGRAVIMLDPKGPLARLCLGLCPADRRVHYLDLGRPEVGLSPLRGTASPGARAAVFVQALIEANPEGAIQAASDSFLRQAVTAVCQTEQEPTLWHVYRLLDPVDASYRNVVIERLRSTDPDSFVRQYWEREFAAISGDRGFAIKSLSPPRNKIERLISTREIDTLLRHPVGLNLEDIVRRGEILIVAGAKAQVGEDNSILITHLLLQQLHSVLQQRQDAEAAESGPVSLLIDEAHNVLTPSVARALAEGRSAGLEAVFAWQYSAQIRDEVVRSGVRSLLQSISILRMREMEDARSLAGLAMEVYSDRISVQQEEQERLRFSPDDIVRLPAHHAINLWVAGGVPRPGFVAQTLPMEELHDSQLERHHRDAQRSRGGRKVDNLPHPCPPADRSKPTRAGKPRRGTRSVSAADDFGVQMPLNLEPGLADLPEEPR